MPQAAAPHDATGGDAHTADATPADRADAQAGAQASAEVSAAADQAFQQAFRGSFTSALRWHHLDALWAVLRADADGGWYLYAVGEPPPQAPASAEQVHRFIDEMDALLRREHDEDYCGIVYADDLKAPALVKIYDPNNLGVVCGFSDNPPLPGWVMSKLKPVDLPAAQPAPKGRRRWWQRLFG